MPLTRIKNHSAGIITSGTFADARIAASNVSQHAVTFDDDKIVNDLSTLGLRVHTQENLTASNTNSQYVDVFQDDSGYTNGADTARSTDEYVGTITTTDSALSSSGVLLDTGSDDDTAETNIGADGGIGYVAQKLYVAPRTKLVIETTTGYSFGTGGSSVGKQYFSLDNSGVPATMPADMGSVYWQLNYSSTANGNAIPYGDTGDYTIDNLAGTTNLTFWWVFHETGGFGGGLWRAKNTGISSTGQYYGTGGGDNTTTKLGAAINSAVKNGDSNTLAIQSDEVWALNIQGKYQTRTVAANATGNFTCPNITAASATTKMGAVITYQDNQGTNALNTDIVLQLSADGGSNYSTATLTALPDFSSGIKMAKVNDLAVTSGTQLKYKISFANQAEGSKEARIRGVSLNY